MALLFSLKFVYREIAWSWNHIHVLAGYQRRLRPGMKSISRSMIMRKLVGIVAILIAGGVSTQAADTQDLEPAKQQFEQSSHDEAARVTYVTKLAQIADRLVSQYRGSGQRNDELMGAINSELQKRPAPKDIDSKKLRQLLVGKWDSPRRTYVYRANGKCGTEGGAIDGNWRIQGNQLIQGDLSGPIILLNQEYFIYSSRGSVFFHSRVKE